MTTASSYAPSVLHFWFEELTPEEWYRSDPSLDQRIRDQFGELHARVCAKTPPDALDSPQTALATLIVLDQFSRNLHRGSAGAFACDEAAQQLTHAMIKQGLASQLASEQQAFAYMPLMHSETLSDQEQSVALFAGTARHAYAVQHRDIVAEFGRFPYRNKTLGRTNTPAEDEWLKTGPTFGQ